MPTRNISLFIGAMVFFMAGAATAQSWSHSYPTEAVKSYLPSPLEGIAVIATGDDIPEAKLATMALKLSLEATGMVGMVMTDQSIGDTMGLSDQAIVTKCSHLPIQAIAITRVFPSSGDSAPNAVTIIYRKDANVLAALSARKGDPITPQEKVEPGAANGVSAETADVVSKVADKSKSDIDHAIEEYENKVVWFQEWIGINARSGAIVASGSVPKQGKHGKPLKGSSFYETVGRPDMAKKYKIRMTVKISSIAVGAGLMVGGLALGLSNTDKDNRKTSLIVALSGAPFILFGTFFRAHPAKTDEAKQMADEYNTKLRQSLDLTDDIVGEHRKLTGFAQLSITPFAMMEGAGISLGGRFHFEMK